MQTLYERLGGATGISALVDDIIEAHMNNPAIKARFLPSRDDAGGFHVEVQRYQANLI